MLEDENFAGTPIYTVFKLDQITQNIRLDDKNYTLQGAIVFVPPITADDIGHYKCIIRINQSWESYDDKETKPEMLKRNPSAVLHSIFYTSMNISEI